MIGPDATVTLDFALHRLKIVLEGLQVYPDKMMDNINMTGGLVFSQRVLLALVNKGVDRDKAYRLVQRNAMMKMGFKNALISDVEVTTILSMEQIDECFSMQYHTKNVDHIYDKVYGVNHFKHYSLNTD